MSTRYVWDRISYTLSSIFETKTLRNSDTEWFNGGETLYINASKNVSYGLDGDRLIVTLIGDIQKFTTTVSNEGTYANKVDTGVSIPKGYYFIVCDQDITTSRTNLTYTGIGHSSFGYSSKLYSYWDSLGRYTLLVDGGNFYQTKESTPDTVSSSSQSAYPNSGTTPGFLGIDKYTYQGSDNIDPTAVSIPSTINGGTAITITVTPGSGKVYGGTVSYQYQVNLAGAGWTAIATTSATSYQYTVPYGTASIQVRVRAQDNIGFTSTTYVTSSSVTVINNQPPTAPGSIDVTNVVAGQQATITLTAATDPDGTIASYIYERSVDGSAWTQIANVNSLTQTDTISADWGTVAYRACAVDDDGASGPYVTSSTTVVNSGWVIISGPAADMGSQPKPFNFTITPSISGTTTSDQITVDVTLDGKSIYNEAVAPGTEIELEIDTRLMRTGDHAISVSATCASYVPAADEYTFTVPAVTIPDGGRMEQLEAQDGQVIFPITLARAVAGLENYSVESKVHPGAYTGSGTYGSGNPNSLTLEFEPKMVIVQGTGGRMAVMIKPSGVGISIGASDSTTLNVTWDGESVSWYNGINAANQMNTNSETYSYTAFG